MEDKNIYPSNFPIPPDPISKKKLSKILKEELLNWKVVKSPLPINPSKERVELYRELLFENFDQVIEFIVLLKPICDMLPHHPRWENTWRTLKIYLSTWDTGHTITFKDVLLARNIEIIYVNEFHNKYEYEENLEIGPQINEKEILSFIDELKKNIAEDNLDILFKKLDTFYSRNDNLSKPDDAILIQSRYSSAVKKMITGELGMNEASVSFTKIRNSLLKFLNVENLLPE